MKRGYCFDGFEEWKGAATKVKLKCNHDGNEWNTTSINHFLKSGKGCPKCGIKRTATANGRPDEDFVGSFIITGAFLSGSTFWRSPHKNQWFSTCPVCSDDEYVKAGLCSGVFETSAGSLQRGIKSCRCSTRFRWTQEQREYKIKDTLAKESDGVSFSKWCEPYTNPYSKLVLNCSAHGEWTTNVTGTLHRDNRCPSCAVRGYQPSTDGYVYVLMVDSVIGGFTGFGITGSPARRIKQHEKSLAKEGFHIVDSEIFVLSGREAISLETEIKMKFPVTPQIVPGFIREATHANLYHDVLSFVRSNTITDDNLEDNWHRIQKLLDNQLVLH